MKPVDLRVREYLIENGVAVGTSLENRVAMRLHRWKCLADHQFRVGRYRLDFAWPDVKVALEADGPHHWRPDVAIKDVSRDAWLRSCGWLVFRVDDSSDELEAQLSRVCEVVNALRIIRGVKP